MAFGIALIAAGIAVLAAAAFVKFRQNKYEFENTTDGGVVQYKDYGSAVGAFWVRQLATGLALIALVLLGYGLMQTFVIYPKSPQGRAAAEQAEKAERDRATLEWMRDNDVDLAPKERP